MTTRTNNGKTGFKHVSELKMKTAKELQAIAIETEGAIEKALRCIQEDFTLAAMRGEFEIELRGVNVARYLLEDRLKTMGFEIIHPIGRPGTIVSWSRTGPSEKESTK